MQRSQFDQIMENYREIQSKSLTNDLNNILMTLCLGERNETTETISYTGPDVLNYKKITLDNLKNVNPNQLKTVILDAQKKDSIYFSYLTKEVDEKRGKKVTLNSGLFKELALEQGEVDKINKIIAQSILNQSGSYSSQAASSTSTNAAATVTIQQQQSVKQDEQSIQKTEIESQNQNNDDQTGADNQSEIGEQNDDIDKNTLQNEDTIDVAEVPKAHISYFPKVAFALLKGRTWQFYIQKLSIIIGRSLINLPQNLPYSLNIFDKLFKKSITTNLIYKKKMNWHIDLEVGASKKVSRQHAVILYNFEKKRFEIKCLSKRFHIKVDNNLYSVKDDPVPLKNKSLITVGNEHFYFFLPKNVIDEAQKKHEHILPDEINADQNIREIDEDQIRNREEGDEDEDMDEDDIDGEDVGRYRQRRNMSMDGDEIDDEEGESLSDIENKSTKRKKLKRNEEYDNNEDSDYYRNREQNSEEEDANNDFLNEEEKEFFKKANQDVNENEDEGQEDLDEELDEDEDEEDEIEVDEDEDEIDIEEEDEEDQEEEVDDE